jgi:hypothetical protein
LKRKTRKNERSRGKKEHTGTKGGVPCGKN